MIDSIDTQQQSLHYHAHQQCSKQWRSFLQVFIVELFTSAGPRDACAFLRHIGTRMASDLALSERDAVEDLEAAINAVWRDMDWGWVRLTPQDRSLRIIHGAYPLPMREGADAEYGVQAMSALLEGIYATWLADQGGEPHVPLHAVPVAPGQALEFVYGQEHHGAR